MGPSRRTRDKGQKTMHDFTKPSTQASPAPISRPSSRPMPQRKSSKDLPMRPLPRPTAPPFFEQALPKPRKKPTIGSPADDAWKIGELVLSGKRISSHVHYGDDGIAHDSESDFEPAATRHRVASERPSLKRKHSTSGLRDDRASMKKRSANKRANRKAPVRIPTQAAVVDNHQSFDGTPSRGAAQFENECDMEEDGDLVVIEGEKLEMSGTDEEEESLATSPTESSSEKRPRISLAGSVVTPAERRGSKPQFSTPDEFPLNREGTQCRNAPRKLPNNDSRLQGATASTKRRPRVVPRLFDSDSDDSLTLRKSTPENGSETRSASASESSLSEDDLQPATTSRDTCPESKERMGLNLEEESACPKKSLFNCDSSLLESGIDSAAMSDQEEYRDERTPRQTRRVVATKAKRRANLVEVVSSDSDSEDENEAIKTSSDEEETCMGEQSRRVVTRSATKKVRQHSQRSQAPAIDLSGLADDTLSGQESQPENSPERGSTRTRNFSRSPASTPLRALNRTRNVCRRKVSLSPDSTSSRPAQGTGVNKPLTRSQSRSPSLIDRRNESIFAVALESTPSPPSTKKRNRLKRLISQESDEDVGVVIEEVDKLQAPELLGSPDVTNQSNLPQSSKKSPDTEWFLERRIDDFSSSSADLRAPSSEEAAQAASKPQERTWRRRKGIATPPVRRDIFKNLGAEGAEKQQRLPSGSTPQRNPKTSTILVDSHHTENDVLKRTCDEVVDLVDVDEEEDPVDAIDSDSPANVDEIRNSSSVPTVSQAEVDEVIPIDDDDDDDDRPPPFNLVVLCQAGESMKQMRARLGEEALMDRVTEAQQAGREIIGGEELGLTSSFNRNVFNRYSRQIVGDQLGRERKAKIVTEQAMRGEFQFNYRGKNRENKPFRGRGKAKDFRGGKKTGGNGRLSNLRKRLG